MRTVKGVKKVDPLGKKEEGTFDFYIEPEDGEDIRAAVFERVVSRGKTLLSLTSNSLSLEQIFLRLTQAADNDEARKMLGIENKTEEEFCLPARGDMYVNSVREVLEQKNICERK